MRFIVKDIETHQHYVVDAEAGQIEWMGTEEDCRQHIKYMTFHDFYYSVKDIHGRTQIPAVTMNYWDIFTSVKDTHIANYFFQVPGMSKASGWTYQLT